MVRVSLLSPLFPNRHSNCPDSILIASPRCSDLFYPCVTVTIIIGLDDLHRGLIGLAPRMEMKSSILGGNRSLFINRAWVEGKLIEVLGYLSWGGRLIA